jgi:hypothetical protein
VDTEQVRVLKDRHADDRFWAKRFFPADEWPFADGHRMASAFAFLGSRRKEYRTPVKGCYWLKKGASTHRAGARIDDPQQCGKARRP